MTLTAGALPGDYDHNGIVDANDYNVWRQNYGTTNAAADGNGNGVVDTADYTIWRANQGATLPGVAAGAAFDTTAVPEPTAATLTFAAMAIAAHCRLCRSIMPPLPAGEGRGEGALRTKSPSLSAAND